MRIDRHIFHDAGHFARLFADIATENQYLPNRVGPFEVFIGDALGYHHLVRPVEAGILIAFQ